MNLDAGRKHLHPQITEMLAIEDSDFHEGHVLSGWVLIFETCGPDGTRTMGTRSSDAMGDSDLPPWTSEGWARYTAASGFFDPPVLDLHREEDDE